MKEWRETDGFPNYMVSNTGEIKSLNYNKTGKENGVADTQFGTVKRKTAYGYIWKFKTL